MDAYSLLRTLGALGIVLGLLAGALWAVRRFDIRLPGRVGAGGTRRLELIERTTLDGKRSVALLRRDGREHLVLLAPEGSVVLETAIIRDEIDHAAEAAREEARREAAEVAKAEAEAMRESFFAMVDTARAGVKDGIQAATGEAVGRAGPALKQVRDRVKPMLGSVKPMLAKVKPTLESMKPDLPKREAPEAPASPAATDPSAPPWIVGPSPAPAKAAAPAPRTARPTQRRKPSGNRSAKARSAGGARA